MREHLGWRSAEKGGRLQAARTPTFRDVAIETGDKQMSSSRSTNVVLCIDDNEDVLELLELLLNDRGYTVLKASSGTRGLELAAIEPVDAVILDYEMPGLNGHDVAVELRRWEPQISIVMFSGAIDIPNQTLSLVDAFVSKGALSAFSSVTQILGSLPASAATNPAV